MARAARGRIVELGGDVEEAVFGTEEGWWRRTPSPKVMVPTTFCWAMLITARLTPSMPTSAFWRILASRFAPMLSQNLHPRWKLVAIGLRPNLLPAGV